MKNVSIETLLCCLVLQIGCVGSRPPVGQVVYVTDTIGGQPYVVSARVGEDGMFANSISKGNTTQTMSGQVTKSGEEYVVVIDYNCVRTNSDGLHQINTRIKLLEGQLQKLGGMGNDFVRIRISSE
ncbi:MAG: hypothetical protein JW749_05285 [Sedimentisphaerales bacterium]|nr:hypothetical protein [Sedimentisphaerales bacterium]